MLVPFNRSILACMVFIALAGANGHARSQTPSQPPGDHPLQPRINSAITRGVAYLKSNQRPNGSWSQRSHQVGYAALCGLALLEAGVPPSDPAVQRAADLVRASAHPDVFTYEGSLTIYFLDRLGDKRDEVLLQQLALRLVAGQNQRGAWSYHCPQPSPEQMNALLGLLRSSPATLARNQSGDPSQALFKVPGLEFPAGDEDNSNTQFALLALWVARRHDVPVDPALRAAIQRLSTSQDESGGWGYNRGGRRSGSSATMTCVGLLGLAMGHGLAPAPSAAAPLPTDPSIAKALAYLGEALDRPENLHNLYLLWSVERVGELFKLRTFAGRDWYDRGARVLLEVQREDGAWSLDGYWGSDAALDTAFALLFLKRSNLARDLTERVARRIVHPEPISLTDRPAPSALKDGEKGKPPALLENKDAPFKPGEAFAAEGFRPLFNGRDLTGWVARDGKPASWRVENGYFEVKPGAGDVMTIEKFGDFQLHLEFWIPPLPVPGLWRGNSGPYLQGRYKIMVLDSWENPTDRDVACGALYKQLAPSLIASKPPGEWQAFDVTFHAPRVDAQGRVKSKGRLTLIHNGIKVIDDGNFDAVSPAALDEKQGAPGPILLQDHGSRVRYRNVQIKPLEATTSEGRDDSHRPRQERTAEAERQAASRLKLAKVLLEDKKLDAAREYLEDILKQFPSTNAAAEARELLEKALPKTKGTGKDTGAPERAPTQRAPSRTGATSGGNDPNRTPLPPGVIVRDPLIYDVTMITTLVVPAGNRLLDAINVRHALPAVRPWSNVHGPAGASSVEPSAGGLQRYDEAGDCHFVEWNKVGMLSPGARLEYRTRFTVRSVHREFVPDQVRIGWNDFARPAVLPPTAGRTSTRDVHPTIAQAADSIKVAHAPAAAIPEFCKWIWNTLQYDATMTHPPPDVAKTLEIGRGHCGHWYFLFEQMCTRAGIPARMAPGLVLHSGDGRGLGDAVRADYDNVHAWAEVHFPGVGWVEVEPFNRDNVYAISANAIRTAEGLQSYAIALRENGHVKSPTWTLRDGKFVSEYGVEHRITFTQRFESLARLEDDRKSAAEKPRPPAGNQPSSKYVLLWDFDATKAIPAPTGEILLPVPSDEPYQKVRWDLSGVRTQRLIPVEGGRVAAVRPSGATFRLRVQVEPTLTEIPKPSGKVAMPADAIACLRDGAAVGARNPKTALLAHQLKANDPLETVANVRQWIKDNMTYQFDTSLKLKEYAALGGIDSILEAKRGDCGAHSGLFVTLCRLAGVPARIIWGPVKIPSPEAVPKETGLPVDQLKAGDFCGHAWAEVYVSGWGWIPVEPQAHYWPLGRVLPDTVPFLRLEPNPLKTNDAMIAQRNVWLMNYFARLEKPASRE